MKITKIRKALKRALSVAVCMAMLATTVCFFDIGKVIADAAASKTSKSPSSESSDLIFYVPEIIYLTPTTGTSSSFQYELDVKYENGTVVPNGTYHTVNSTDTNNSIYFSYSYASNISLSYAWYTGSSGTLSVSLGSSTSSGTSLSTKITSGTASYSSGATQYILWTLTFTDTQDRITKTVNQMTGVYSPLLNTALSLTNSYSYSGSSYRYAHIGSAIVGLNAITSNQYATKIYLGTNGYSNFKESDIDCKGTYFAPITYSQTERINGTYAVPYWCVNHDSSGYSGNSPNGSTKTNHPHNYITESSSTTAGASCWYSRTDSTDINYIGGSGTVYFDSSRQSTFQDIPNFDIYTDIIGVNSTGDLKAASIYYGGYYTGTLSQLTTSGNDFSTENVYLGVNNSGSSRYTVSVGSGFRGSPYGCSNSSVTGPSSTATSNFKNQTLVNGKGLVNFSRSSINRKGTNWWCTAITVVGFTGADKSSLRSSIATVMKKASILQDSFFSTSNNQYSSYKSTVLGAMKNLCTVNTTSVSAVDTSSTSVFAKLLTDDAISGEYYSASNSYARFGNGNAGGTIFARQYTAKVIPTSTSGTYTFNGVSSTSEIQFRSVDSLSFTKDTLVGYTYLGIERCTLDKQTKTSSDASKPAPTNTVFGKSVGDSISTSEMGLVSSSGTNNTTGEVINPTNGTVDYYHATGGSKYYTYYYHANKYNISYNLNSGTAGTTAPTSAYFDAPFYVSAPTRSGYKFVGWTVTGNLDTSTAKWGTSSSPSTAISSTTTKCVNGASGNVYFKNLNPSNSSGSITVTLTANWIPILDLNWKFNGNTNNNGDGTKAKATITVNGTAVATNVADYYDGIEPGSTVRVAVTAESGWTLINPTSSGGTFIEFTMPSTTYSCVPQVNSKYSVSYDANGGTGSMESQSFVYAESKGLTTNAFTKTGYYFSGWNNCTELVNDTNVYSIDYSAGTGNYSELKSYYLPGSYSSGDVYIMECDAKSTGTGNFVTYFYGETNYLKVDNAVNSEGVISGNGDGYNVIPKSSDYRHYKVTFTLGNTGDGSVTKILLFRALQGANISVKNITFRKVLGTYTDGQTVSNLTAQPNGTVVMYANWSRNPYSVKFNGNGNTGGSMSNQSFTYDVAQVLTANAFTRAYTVTYKYNGNGASDTTATATYTFKHWTTAQDGTGTAYTNQQSVSNLTTTKNGVVDLWAQWNSASVTTPNPSRTGYTFANWYDAATGGNLVVNGNTAYTPTANKTLFAHWNANQYTVTLDRQGGTGGSGSATPTYDSSMPAITPPTKTGYTFGGYYTGTGGSGTQYYNYDGSSAHIWDIANNTTTLYAKWTKNTFYVSFAGGTGATGSTSKQTFEYDTAQSLNANGFSKTGYHFRAWKATSNLNEDTAKYGNSTSQTNQITSNVELSDSTWVKNLNPNKNADVTLTAQWTANSYTVKYNLNYTDAPENYASQPATYDTSVAISAADPTRTGYTFGGWYKDTACTDANKVTAINNLTAINNGTVNLYAKWTINQSTVTVNPNTGSVKVDGTTITEVTNYKKAYLQTLTLTEPTKTGYHVTSWTLSGSKSGSITGTDVATYTYGPTKDAIDIISAVWTANKYTVKYDLNYTGAPTNPSDREETYDEDITLPSPNPTRTGYTFGGWFTDKTCTSGNEVKSRNLTTVNNGTVTLYAKWTAITYYIEYDYNGATGGIVGTLANGKITVPCSFDSHYTAPSPVKTVGGIDYEFLGWKVKVGNTLSDVVQYFGGEDVFNASSTDNEVIHLVAYWLEADVHHPTVSVGNAGEIISSGYILGNPGDNGWDSRAIVGLSVSDSSSGEIDLLTGKTLGSTYTYEKSVSGKYNLKVTYSVNYDNDNKTNYPAISTFEFTPDITIGAETCTIYLEIKSTYEYKYKGNNEVKKDVSYTSITFTPQTTILFNEDSGSFTNGSDCSWTTVGAKKSSKSADMDGVYGYSSMYSSDVSFSGGTSKRTSVYNTTTSNPKYEFTFKGTGFTLYSTCDNECGLMLLAISCKISGKWYSYVSPSKITYAKGSEDYNNQIAANNITGMNKAINTYYSDGTLYQSPTYSNTGLPYGEYKVTVTASYSYYFDNTEKANTTTASLTSGEVVDLANELGEDYAECEYYCVDDGESFSISRLRMSDYEPVLLGKRNLPDGVEGGYDVNVDSVRIYNPAGENLSSGEVYTAYSRDNELNPTYLNIKNELTGISGSFFVDSSYDSETETSTPSGITSSWQEYQKKGSAYELLISNYNAVSFNVGTVSSGQEVHISLRAPNGSTTVQVGTGSKALTMTLNSTTAQYFDVTQCVSSSGELTVTCGNAKMVAVGEVKLIGKSTITTSSYGQDLSILNDIIVENVTNPIPVLDNDIDFRVDMTEGSETTLTISKEALNYEKVDGKWTVCTILDETELNEILCKAGLSDDYELTANELKLTAEYDGENWVAQETPIILSIKVDDLSFRLIFGELGEKAVIIEKEDIVATENNGRITATAQLTDKEIEELFNSFSSAENYQIKNGGTITLTAEKVDGEWVTKDVIIDVESNEDDAQESSTFFDKIVKLFEALFSKIVKLITSAI